ncbi:plasmid mobilization relaxosome protein MobC [uncultured Tateyamaria sp.]|uniref:plasmid mobilization relaxosome protein MobC n=2 Tax=uncultured Tateyamaria sp. TaxID=455651 RepID=UPI00260AD295|nr:plasmid mobilization relaxosome protein MobC [uncultured Tateyamaria sp.]
MLQGGMSDVEVAAKLGVKRDTIYRLKKRMSFTSSAQKSATRSISFRLSEDEFRAFASLAIECGCKSNAEFARVLSRSATGFIEVSREKADELEEIRYELNKIGTNINQIAWAANSKKIELVASQWSDIRQLKTDIGSLRTYLAAVVAETRRRGTRLWRKSEYGHE